MISCGVLYTHNAIGSGRATGDCNVIGHSPLCQVMAGRGAPAVSQCRMMDMPSITALSAGPTVMLGAIPAENRVSERARR